MCVHAIDNDMWAFWLVLGKLDVLLDVLIGHYSKWSPVGFWRTVGLARETNDIGSLDSFSLDVDITLGI